MPVIRACFKVSTYNIISIYIYIYKRDGPKKIHHPDIGEIFWVCLDRTYFAETEN